MDLPRDIAWRHAPAFNRFPTDGPSLGILIVENQSSQYGHTFGGGPAHHGVTPVGCEKPIHLLYNFNLSDPNVPVELKGIGWLPLYFPIPYNVSPIHSYVRSDRAIQIVRQPVTELLADFPYKNYPSYFPRTRGALDKARPLELNGVEVQWFKERDANQAPLPNCLGTSS